MNRYQVLLSLLKLTLVDQAVAFIFSSQLQRSHRTPPFITRRNAISSPENDSLEWSVSQEDRTKSSLEEDESGNIHIPSAGLSVSDEMEAAQKDRLVTEVVPIKDLPGVVQLVTTPLIRGSFDPVRYLVALTPPVVEESDGDDDPAEITMPPGTMFVMVDVPPFSPQLATRMQAYMGSESKLAAILVTSRDSIHYDEAPSVFAARRSDIDLWKQAFPDVQVVAYRLDIPRDCRPSISQCLDGYGPFALYEPSTGNMTFVESGRPLTVLEWDHDVAQGILNGQPIPDDEAEKNDDDELYTAEAIRAREEGKRVLAVYTPGHSFGSVSYIFPEARVVCSGFTIPVEDCRAEENEGIEGAGPALDCRGYITTSRAGISRQMESARKLVNTYVDRFDVVLPARGDPLFLDGDATERKETLSSIIDQYDKVGRIYEQLGIMSSDDSDYD